MPRRASKKGKKSSRKRPWTKKRTIKNSFSSKKKDFSFTGGQGSIVNTLGPIRQLKGVPRRKYFELRYAEALPPAGISVGTAGICGTEILYGLNSLFDPNQSGTGHQPYYYDQMVGCGYQRYRVDTVSIKVRAANANESATGLMVQLDGWNGATGALTGATWNYCKERPGTDFIIPNQATTGSKEWVLEDVPLHVLQGMTKHEYDQVESYSAVVSASPARVPYLRIAACNFDGSNSGTIYGTVELIFKGHFMDPQVVAQS